MGMGVQPAPPAARRVQRLTPIPLTSPSLDPEVVSASKNCDVTLQIEAILGIRGP